MPRKKKESKEKASETEVPVEKKKKAIVPKKKESPFVVAPVGSDLNLGPNADSAMA